LVDPKNTDAIGSEIENRLDDLFGETDIQLTNPTEKNPTKKKTTEKNPTEKNPTEKNPTKKKTTEKNPTEKNPTEQYPLAELKNLILSIDWEITDEVLDNLLLQLKDLQSTYQHDKIATSFLQILNSLGSYIRTHRAKAHPKTFKILNSVFSSFDKVVLSKDMTGPAKKKILRAEMNRYKKLRTRIAKRKAAAVKRKSKPVVTEAPEIKFKKEEPTLKLDEPSATLEIKEKEEPVIKLEEPSATPEIKEKEEEPFTLLDEPSVVPGIEENDKEPLIILGEPSEPPPKAAKEDLPVTHPESESEREQPAAAALADAVEEIKQYIHTEIKALMEEIQSLREQI